MENLALDFYHYTHFIKATQHLYKEFGVALLFFIIPLVKFNTMYIYSWWKLILLHLICIVSFNLVFNSTEIITEFAEYITGSGFTYPRYITTILILYVYTYISIVLMYINALVYERYELAYDIKTIWRFFKTLFKLLFKLSNTKPIQKNTTHNKSIQTTKAVKQITTPKTTVKKLVQSQKITSPKPKKKEVKKTKQINNDNLQKVYTDKGYAYSLQKQIALGGEGKVHIISSSLLAKIFHNGQETNEKKEKIIKLLEVKKISSVVFPQRLLYDSNKKFIGYTMNQIFDTKELGILHIPANRKKYFPHWTYIDLLDLSITIANTLKRLHEQRVIVADFNPRNVLVKESKKVYFIDTDSYQINRQPSTVGMKMYTRPIHMNKSHKQYLKNQSDDIYALSVIIFQNLMSGANPYVIKGESNEEELIKRQEFSFNVNDPYKSNVKDELIGAWSNLSDSLREYFEQVFKYQNPVSISTLKQALQNHKICLMRVQIKTRRK